MTKTRIRCTRFAPPTSIGKDATTPCYVVLAEPVSEEDDDEEEEEEVEYESYRINDMLYDMIRDSRSEHPEDFQIEEE